LGEQFTSELEEGQINNIDEESRVGFQGRSENTVYPDGIVSTEGLPPKLNEVKVGVNHDYEQALAYESIIQRGLARPGTVYFLESPYTGELGADDRTMNVFVRSGFGLVSVTGPWWEAMQD